MVNYPRRFGRSGAAREFEKENMKPVFQNAEAVVARKMAEILALIAEVKTKGNDLLGSPEVLTFEGYKFD